MRDVGRRPGGRPPPSARRRRGGPDDSRDVIVVTCFTSPLSIVSLLTPPPTAKMQAWGGFTTALNSVMPNIPKFDTVKVPPWNSSGLSLLSLALVARSLHLGRDDAQALAGRIKHNRRDQPGRRRHGHTNINLVVRYLVVPPQDEFARGTSRKRQSYRLDHDVVHRDLDAKFIHEVLPQLGHAS